MQVSELPKEIATLERAGRVLIDVPCGGANTYMRKGPIMNTSTDTAVNQSREDLFQLLLCGVGAVRSSEKSDRNEVTQPTAEVQQTSKDAAALLFALFVARQITARMEDERVKETVSRDLDRSIATLIERFCSEIRELPSAQSQGVSDKALAPVVGALSLLFQGFTETVRADLFRIISQILQSDSAIQKLREKTSPKTIDGPSAKETSASPLADVISYSSSLHDCWFW